MTLVLALTSSDYIRIAGWVITFILGAISAGIIVPALTKKRKTIGWAITSENQLIPKELSEELNININITAENDEIESLSSVKIRIANIGNETIEKIPFTAIFNDEAKIIQRNIVGTTREYKKVIEIVEESNNEIGINVAYMNPGQSFDIEFLLNKYILRSIDIDAAKPRLTIKRQTLVTLDTEIFKVFTRSLRLGLFGFSIDPTAIVMNDVVEELRSIRKEMQGKRSKDIIDNTFDMRISFLEQNMHNVVQKLEDINKE